MARRVHVAVKPERHIKQEVRSLILHPLMRETVLTAAAHDMNRVQIEQTEDGTVMCVIVRNKPIKKKYN